MAPPPKRVPSNEPPPQTSSAHANSNAQASQDLETSPSSTSAMADEPTQARPAASNGAPEVPPRGDNTSSRWRPARICGHLTDVNRQPPLQRTRSQTQSLAQALFTNQPAWCQHCLEAIKAVSDLRIAVRNLERLGVGPISHIAWWKEADEDEPETAYAVEYNPNEEEELADYEDEHDSDYDFSDSDSDDDAPDIPARLPQPTVSAPASLRPSTPAPPTLGAPSSSTSPSPTPSSSADNDDDTDDLPTSPTPSTTRARKTPPTYMPPSWSPAASRARRALDRARLVVANLRLAAAERDEWRSNATSTTMTASSDTFGSAFEGVDAVLAKFGGGVDFAGARVPVGLLPQRVASVVPATATATASSVTDGAGGEEASATVTSGGEGATVTNGGGEGQASAASMDGVALPASMTTGTPGGAPPRKKVKWDATQNHRVVYRSDERYRRASGWYVPGEWAGEWEDTSWFAGRGPWEEEGEDEWEDIDDQEEEGDGELEEGEVEEGEVEEGELVEGEVQDDEMAENEADTDAENEVCVGSPQLFMASR